MAALAQALSDINSRELDANEQALAQLFPRAPELSPEAQQHLVPFVQWCEVQRVRSLPARPASCAAFAQWQRDLGVPGEKISATLAAVEQLHFAAGQSNPIATPLVRTLTAASTIEPPRSWTRDEQSLFRELPVEVQLVVSRRERDRETTLRRAQNEAADLRRLLKTTEPKEETNSDGPYTVFRRHRHKPVDSKKESTNG
jgi:hypothetical protein